MIFLLERSTLLRQESSNIFELLNASLPTWEWIFKPKQYGLMVFDDQGFKITYKCFHLATFSDIQTLINTFDIKDYLKKLQVTLANLTYKEASNSSRVLDAIYIVMWLSLSHLYTMMAMINSRHHNWNWCHQCWSMLSWIGIIHLYRQDTTTR